MEKQNIVCDQNRPGMMQTALRELDCANLVYEHLKADHVCLRQKLHQVSPSRLLWQAGNARSRAHIPQSIQKLGLR